MNGDDGRVRWLLKGISDRAALFSLANTLRAVTCGPLTAFLIATRFSANVQGYYYTFVSLLALQVFAELGLSAVVVQFASHEWVHLHLSNGRVQGSERHRSRLADLLRFAVRWYAGAGVGVLFPLCGFGLYFLGTADAFVVGWKAPWLALCGLTAIRLMLTPAFAVLEGCGQVASTYGFRLVDGIVATAIGWTSIFVGFELWMAPLTTAGSVLVALIFLSSRYRRFFASLFAQEIGERINWRGEVLPMQWRIALSWLSGYFVFQLFTPVLFHYRGAREAGRFGLTWNMVSSINAIGAAFLQTKAPAFGALAASRRFPELDRTVFRAFGLAALGTLAGSLALLGLLVVLPSYYPSLADRCLTPGPTAILLAATLLMQISYAQSGYLRAFKTEPYLVLSLLFGGATGVLTWSLGRLFGASGVAWGYLGAVVLIVLPLGTWIFVRRRSQWIT